MIADANRAGKGFTLTELLVVMSIIIILLSMLVVCVDGIFVYVTRMQCQHRMEQLWTACVMYSNKNRILPGAWDFDNGRPWYAMLVASGYLDNFGVCTCPSSDIASTYGEGTSIVSGPIPEERQRALAKCLNWMKANQKPDGAIGYIPGESSAFPQLKDDAGLTGLGLLAFLGYGRWTSDPQYGDTVEQALMYLINRLQPDGRIGDIDCIAYHQSVVVMALSDAYAMMGDITPADASKPLGDAAQDAFDFLLSIRGERWGDASIGHFEETWSAVWGGITMPYDASVSAWGHQAIGSAKNASIYPSTSGVTWDSIDAVSDTFFARCIRVNRGQCQSGHLSVPRPASGTCWCGQPVSPLTDSYYTCYRFDPFSASNEGWEAWGDRGGGVGSYERMTAANLTCRLILGHGLGQDPSDPADRTYSNAENAFNQMAWLTQGNKHINYAKRSGGGYDLYYIYYMTLAMFAAGVDYWDEWLNGNSSGFDGFVPYLLAGMTNDGPQDVEEPKGYFWDGLYTFDQHEVGARVFPTALGAICLDASVGNYVRGSKFNTSVAGVHSYGYNKLIANDENRRRTPAGDTIVLIDYMRSAIDPADPTSYIAPRHGGKVNVFFGDGHTKALTFDELTEEDPDSPGVHRIKSHMLSLQGGSDPAPVVEEP